MFFIHISPNTTCFFEGSVRIDSLPSYYSVHKRVEVRPICHDLNSVANLVAKRPILATGKVVRQLAISFWQLDFFLATINFQRNQYRKIMRTEKCAILTYFLPKFPGGGPPDPPLGGGIPTHTFPHRCITRNSATGCASCQKNFTHLATANICFRNTVEKTSR